MIQFKRHINKAIHEEISIAPLVVFRILFGAVMCFSILRFMINGWVYDQYVKPQYFFTYFGFEWVQPLGEVGMNLLFVGLAISAVCILLGCFYRVSTLFFFFVFTYIELIDQTNYLNHYYFVSIVSFLLLWVPANAYFSVDCLIFPTLKRTKVPAWTVNIFKLQLGMVYFFAGVAKLNADWMFHALPLRIWLPAQSDLPILGSLLKYTWVAYLFSWAGAVYDLTIPFLLGSNKTRKWAYVGVVGFHVVTWLMFPIGMFPWIMIGLTLIFFSPAFHERILQMLQKPGRLVFKNMNEPVGRIHASQAFQTPKLILFILIFHFSLQTLLPFRHLFYPGELFWTEEGYRFSWRVMLMEKGGYANFRIVDTKTQKEMEVSNCEFLTAQQEKMMSTQPDMILQFAHFLKNEYEARGLKDIEVKVNSYVSLNGRKGQTYIDPNLNLAQLNESFQHKKWILPREVLK